jgi:hypothetical protein
MWQICPNFSIVLLLLPNDKIHNNVKLICALNVLNNSMKHWSIGSRWEMIDYMCEQILKRTQIVIARASFISSNVDKVIIVDNQSRLSIHVYVMHAWNKPFILLTFQCVV